MWLYGPLPLGSAQVASAALGSNSILLQQGSTTRTHTVALSGSEAAFSQGTESPNRSKALASFDDPIDTKITSGIGNVTYVVESGSDIEVFLLGQESNAYAGWPAPTGPFNFASAAISKPLSGEASTSGIGTLIPGIRPTTLVSQLIQPAAGTLVYELPGSGDVTVNINAGEMEINSFIGSVKTASPLSGTAVATAQQSFATVSNTPTATLLGQSITSAQTSVTVDQGVEDTFITSGIGSVVFTMVTALSGTEVAFAQGTVGVTGDVTAALLGEAVAVEIESMEDGFEMPLTGIEMLGEQTDDNFGLPLNIELVGLESLVEAGTVYLDNDRAYPLIGMQSLVEQSSMPSFVNAFVNGEFIFLSQENIGPREAALTGIEITTEQFRFRRGMNHAGGKKDKKPKKGDVHVKKHHKTVEIDGQMFQVDDEEQLQQLIATAKEIARSEATRVVAEQVAAKSKERIKLKVPKIKGNEELQEAITDIYTQATIDAEVSRNRQLDEEEALVLLLLN